MRTRRQGNVIGRALQLWDLLATAGERRVTVHQVEEHLEVSRRVAYRYLAAALATGRVACSSGPGRASTWHYVGESDRVEPRRARAEEGQTA